MIDNDYYKQTPIKNFIPTKKMLKYTLKIRKPRERIEDERDKLDRLYDSIQHSGGGARSVERRSKQELNSRRLSIEQVPSHMVQSIEKSA